jgi:hypothetical protein
MRFAGAVVVALASAVACGPLVPHPPYVGQPTEALEAVERAPPPARVEVLPLRPTPEAVWVDGQWIWHRARWAWLLGRWVQPPPGAVYSPWVFVRAPDGKLWYAPGTWRDGSGGGGRRLEAPRALALASVQGGAVVNAEGETEATGPVLREVPRSAQPTEPVHPTEPAPP